MTRKRDDPTKTTIKHMRVVLSDLMGRLEKIQAERPDLVVAFWPSLIGEKLAPFTEVTRFAEGVLHVKVKNSSLYSLLVQQERGRLLKKLQEKFPRVEIRNIVFRMG